MGKKKNFTAPANYLDDFKRAEMTFLHQRVWDPTLKKLVPLTPFETDEDDTVDFIGPDLDQEIAEKIATGT